MLLTVQILAMCCECNVVVLLGFLFILSSRLLRTEFLQRNIEEKRSAEPFLKVFEFFRFWLSRVILMQHYQQINNNFKYLCKKTLFVDN